MTCGGATGASVEAVDCVKGTEERGEVELGVADVAAADIELAEFGPDDTDDDLLSSPATAVTAAASLVPLLLERGDAGDSGTGSEYFCASAAIF